MSGILGGKYLPKGTVPRVCTCGVVIYRLWEFSDKLGCCEHRNYDCEVAGSLPPKKRIGGVGQAHVCKSARKTA